MEIQPPKPAGNILFDLRTLYLTLVNHKSMLLQVFCWLKYKGAAAVRKIDLNNFHVATNGLVRNINSRIVLNWMRKHQPVSRANLMSCSGMQRSIMSVITERLLSKRWRKEGLLGELPLGRKPTGLQLYFSPPPVS
jgi:hypothetical protein